MAKSSERNRTNVVRRQMFASYANETKNNKKKKTNERLTARAVRCDSAPRDRQRSLSSPRMGQGLLLRSRSHRNFASGTKSRTHKTGQVAIKIIQFPSIFEIIQFIVNPLTLTMGRLCRGLDTKFLRAVFCIKSSSNFFVSHYNLVKGPKKAHEFFSIFSKVQN